MRGDLIGLPPALRFGGFKESVPLGRAFLPDGFQPAAGILPGPLDEGQRFGLGALNRGPGLLLPTGNIPNYVADFGHMSV